MHFLAEKQKFTANVVVGLLGNESSDLNRFTLVTPKSENDVRLQATLDNQNPMGLPVGAVSKHQNRYICVDGHSRLYYSMILKKKFVQAIIIESQPYMWKFSNESMRRKIYSIKDVSIITDNEYQKKWIEYCKNIHF